MVQHDQILYRGLTIVAYREAGEVRHTHSEHLSYAGQWQAYIPGRFTSRLRMSRAEVIWECQHYLDILFSEDPDTL